MMWPALLATVGQLSSGDEISRVFVSADQNEKLDLVYVLTVVAIAFAVGFTLGGFKFDFSEPSAATAAVIEWYQRIGSRYGCRATEEDAGEASEDEEADESSTFSYSDGISVGPDMDTTVIINHVISEDLEPEDDNKSEEERSVDEYSDILLASNLSESDQVRHWIRRLSRQDMPAPILAKKGL